MRDKLRFGHVPSPGSERRANNYGKIIHRNGLLSTSYRSFDVIPVLGSVQFGSVPLSKNLVTRLRSPAEQALIRVDGRIGISFDNPAIP